jgi:hypothetical protein
MATKYSDSQIQELISEAKQIERQKVVPVPFSIKRGHKEADIDFDGAAGSRFRLIFRQSLFNVLDFSVILGVFPEGSNQLFRLRRYNGKSHEHRNKIEGHKFYTFHIHFATERYQHLGFREDAYAEPSALFTDIDSALRCMIGDCGFVIQSDGQSSLFEEL